MKCFCLFSRRVCRVPRSLVFTLFSFAVLVASLASGPGVRAAEPVIITEFVASNQGGLLDEDGDASDWIEVFNGSGVSVNLDGWFLTDSPANPAKWRFPAVTLAPNGFLVVFASGKNRAVPGLPLHANFQLSAGGEYLALVKPDGATRTSEFNPFPDQLPNISYGLGQNVQVTALVSNPSPARVLVPSNSALGLTWTLPGFDDSGWRAGTNGVGYENSIPGFAVRNIRANIGVCDLATADGVLANPSQQAAVFTANPAVINYLNSDSPGNFTGDASFPGFTIGVDENNFVTEATGILTIPTSGFWTFGVNSDDGFRCDIGANTFSYPSPRGAGDTLATFNLAAGNYPVRLVFYECGGGSELEFFAAAGSLTGFNATAFRLVGNTAGGGLAVRSLPVGGTSGASLRSLIVTDVQTNLLNRNSSAYVRLPFNVVDPGAFASLTLRVKYDDGFVAYLNGVEVGRRNAPAAPAWNSAATAARSAAAVQAFDDLGVPPNLLQAGANVLAFHGLNVSSTDGDFLVYAELAENKVLGLTNHYFAVPTPGTFNGSGAFAFVENLKFTPGRGWFNPTNFTVTITSATPGITIRYTTNGTAPTVTSGLVYNGSGISVGGTLFLRAIGYRSGFEPTEVETHTYLFLDQVQGQSTNVNWAGGSSGDYTLNTNITRGALYGPTFKSDLTRVPTLSIVAASDDLFGPNGVYSNPGAYGVAWERPCSIEYWRPDGEKGFNVNAGLRIQGGVSRSAIPKHGLRLLFKGIYGPSKLEYPLYPDSAVREFDTLTLHGSFNDHWLWVGGAATMQRDQWCRDTQNALGGFGPHGTYAHLYLNGIYWGLYNVGEKGDASYAASYLGGEKEEYDAFNSDEVIDGDANAWNTMFNLANAGITNDVAYTNLSQYLNIPNFVDYLLLNFYAANTDWPGHNWNAARRRVPGAGFHFFSWDAEWTFGVGSDVNTDRTGMADGSPGRLYAALRAHPEFRQLFADRAQRHMFNGGALTPGAAQARWSKRQTEIERAIIPEIARWAPGNTPATWQAAEANVLSWFPQRTTILINQLRNAGLYPQLNAPGFSQLGGLVPPGYSLTLTNPNPSGSVYFTTDGTDPRQWGGGLASSAQLAAGPVVLNRATFVRARVRDGANWSALVEATFYLVQDYSGLSVTEIMYHPEAGAQAADEYEFVELKNIGSTTLDLSGLEFTEGLTFACTNGTSLAPGAFFVLVRNAAAFASRYPGVAVQGVYEGRLDNGGERLTLAHRLGTNVFSFSFNNAVPWPITPDGYGFSLVRVLAAGQPMGRPDAPAAWRPSTLRGGSPGADDPAPTVPTVLIHEVLTHTDPPALDAIELYNPNAVPVDLSGWFLSDDAAFPKKFRLPAGTTIAAGGFFVLDESRFNPVPGVFPSFALNSHGEALYLFSGDATTNLTGYSHSFEYGPAANGVSFGRYVISTGEEQWPASSANTLGAVNAGPRVGPVVINEVQYHPALGHDEFVELHNLSGTPVSFHDAAFPTNAWKLNGLGYTLSNSVTLGAGDYLLLVNTDPAAFRLKYAVPASVQILGPYAGSLQDSGENLELRRPDAPDTNGVPYVVVDAVRYNDRLPWPPGADGDGPSLQRRAPTAYGNEPTNWFASGITPGAANAFNLAPACVLTAPSDGASYTVPVEVVLSADASDADGTVSRVEFYEGDVLLGVDTTAPYSMVWSNVPVGTHTIVAKARDNGLAVAPSTPVTIQVQPPPIGGGVGLRADYYDNIDFTGTRVRRVDPVIDFDWGSGPPDPAIGADTFSVRWIGQVQPRFNETYTFYITGDDGIRLWVNNQLLVDRWIDQGPTEYTAFVPMQAGFLYDLKMEMYENGGGAVARLHWSAPSVPREAIPSTQLYPPLGSNLPPTVTLTAPATGSVFVATSTVNLAADAGDLDGAVLRVEFWVGANGLAKLGEDTTAPYLFPWTNVPAGQQVIRAVAIDDSGLSRTSAPVSISVLSGFTSNLTLIPTGSVWRYLDNGTDQGSDWRLLGFNDLGWSNGPAQLGYGDSDERTVVSFGLNASAKYVTTYFRRAFSIADYSAFSALALRVIRDDGVVVYLNGTEIYRSNLPGGPIGFQTLAPVSIGGADESAWNAAPIDPGGLINGENVIAVEIHQNSGTSSDISFDFELTGLQSFVAPVVTVQPASQAVAEGSPVTLSVGAVGTAPFRYQWRWNGAAVSGATNANLIFPAIQRAQAGDYSCVVSNMAGVATSAVAVVTVSNLDSDGDGVPDAWELAHGTDPNVNDAGLDPDGDGMSNGTEFVAGTHPRDSASYLRVDLNETGPGPAGRTVSFTAVSNRTYSVLYRDALETGEWQRLLNVPARTTNRVESLLDPAPAGLRRFYRLVTPAVP